jgi:excisionase family DNA binding protein
MTAPNSKEGNARVKPNDAMTVQEASAYLAMDEASLTRMAIERRIPAIEVDGTWVFSRKSIDKWRRNQEPRPR